MKLARWSKNPSVPFWGSKTVILQVYPICDSRPTTMWLIPNWTGLIRSTVASVTANIRNKVKRILQILACEHLEPAFWLYNGLIGIVSFSHYLNLLSHDGLFLIWHPREAWHQLGWRSFFGQHLDASPIHCGNNAYNWKDALQQISIETATGVPPFCKLYPSYIQDILGMLPPASSFQIKTSCWT